MNGLKNRGVANILVACVDGFTGFPQPIEAVYPQAQIQQCIIHQIRNLTRFVFYKDIKKLMADLKLVYTAPTEETALQELELFRDNWATLSTYFKYPEAVRRLIYTTNAIEGFNKQLRKVTKSKTIFPSDDRFFKTPYLSNKYGLGSHSQIQRWINSYQKYGDEGLMLSRKIKNYSFEFKLHMVELYLSTEVSYEECALPVGMNNSPHITKWVNDFRIAGPDALRTKKKGREKLLGQANKSKKIIQHQKKNHWMQVWNVYDNWKMKI